jgi:hypothetical protein
MATAVSLRDRSSLELGVQPLTLEGAIDHLVGAAQGVVENEIQLAKLEVQETAGRIVRASALIVVGAFLLGGAAVAAAMAGYHAFPPDVSPVVRLGIIAGVSAVLGLVLAAVGAQRIGSRERAS